MNSSVRSTSVYLTLDIGNTRSKFALFNALGNVVENGVVENLTELTGLLPVLNGVAYCNVTGSVPQGLVQFQCPITELRSGSKLPFLIDYETPDKLGSDRLAAAAGAAVSFPGQNVLIVDAGTCLKLDWVDEKGVFHGGSISPGLQMRYKALESFTGKLPLVEDEREVQWPGKSTRDSILAGVRLGFLAEVEARINEIESQNPGITVVLTGGDAPVLAERLKNRIFVEPLLIHKGLFHCLLLNEN